MVDDDMRLIDVGDIRCACGLVFRYARTAAGATFWPQDSATSFCATPTNGDDCIRCSAPLLRLIPHASSRGVAAA
jgi:hypothetical protein